MAWSSIEAPLNNATAFGVFPPPFMIKIKSANGTIDNQ